MNRDEVVSEIAAQYRRQGVCSAVAQVQAEQVADGKIESPWPLVEPPVAAEPVADANPPVETAANQGGA